MKRNVKAITAESVPDVPELQHFDGDRILAHRA
jgi:hypothetical protein